MQSMAAIFLAITFSAALANRAVAADDSAARAIVEKAIKAHGGEKNFARFKGYTRKSRGRIFQQGQPATTMTDEAVLPPDCTRVEVRMSVGGQTYVSYIIQNREGTWMNMNGRPLEASAAEVAELKEDLYADWVITCLPILDKQFKLEALPETKVDGQPAVGVKVTHKDHREIRLFFHKDKGMLLKSERQRKDLQKKSDVDQETLYRDYRTIQGIKYAMRERTLRAGKTAIESETTELRWMEKIDPRLFEKP